MADDAADIPSRDVDPELADLEEDWAVWLATLFPEHFTSAMGPHHIAFWDHMWTIEAGKRPRPWVAIWPRGAGKSASAEIASVALAARQRRSYIIWISETQEQADNHVQNVATLLESDVFEAFYPDHAQRMLGKYGAVKGWRRNRLRTAGGFTLDALGLDVAARGLKLDENRPDGLVCHQAGTQIYSDGRWMAVEEHPSFSGVRESSGWEAAIWGVPTTEVVTPEHRYWCQKRRLGKNWGEAGWMTADEIAELRDRPGSKWTVGIGLPVDTAIEPIRSVPIRTAPMRYLQADGEVLIADQLLTAIPDELSDPDWWWLIGLWWGDGTVGRKRGRNNKHAVSIVVADTQPEIADRLTRVLAKWAYGWSFTQRVGCGHYTFSCKWLHLWAQHGWKRYAEGDIYRPGQKCPPEWVERIAPALQRELIRGYVDADGCVEKMQCRITSVSLAGLLCLRRILARLGVGSSIRSGHPAGTVTIRGVTSNTQQKYDLCFSQSGDQFGLNLPQSQRFRTRSRSWVENGFLWSGVRSMTPVESAKFSPIRTESGTYTTHFGLSHNCDDLDSERDTALTINRKVASLTRKILPAGTPDLAVICIQNLVSNEGIFGQLAGRSEDRADYLIDRIVSGPIPAVENLQIAFSNGRWNITGGTPTWTGQDLDACQDFIDTYGPSAFRAELQHDVEVPPGGMYDHLDFPSMRVTREDFEKVNVDRVAVWVDPAVTKHDTSDSHAIQVDALGRDGLLYRLFTWEQRATPLESLTLAFRKCLEYGSTTLGVETDQGGDTWKSVFREARAALMREFEEEEDYASVAQLEAIRMRSAKAGEGHGSKVHRSSRMLVAYERHRIRHVMGTHDVLEAALRRFPRTKPFDGVDVAYWSWLDLAGKVPAKSMSVAGRKMGRRLTAVR